MKVKCKQFFVILLHFTGLPDVLCGYVTSLQVGQNRGGPGTRTYQIRKHYDADPGSNRAREKKLFTKIYYIQ